MPRTLDWDHFGLKEISIMRTVIRTCLYAGIAGAALTLAGCGDSSDVKDVTPRTHDANAPKIDPDAGPGGGFVPMEEKGTRDPAGN